MALAVAVGTSTTTIHRIESGDQDPGAEILLKIAETLGHDVAPLRRLFLPTSVAA